MSYINKYIKLKWFKYNKKQRLSDWIKKKKDPNICCLHFKYYTNKFTIKGWEKVYYENTDPIKK